ncbi:MAG: hypothetical protein Sv326_1348 (plasmid) [Candidatus Fermentimicrarchaeum limneticum]|uniref:Uncharacterized protein n=1 Tax=Fermentimicrarchaeum limneticum TaxID=2795018 RepID=A0A7D6BR91_FERL1|nr:MAG: hypothetical protein Sv326_1348 [Candidatus Fermentimicrarchaeum limneticum]
MKKGYKGACVQIYLNPKRFAEEVKRAERAGIRRVGLFLYLQKIHGFSDEKIANTKKLAKYYKMCSDYWEEHEAERLQKKAEAELKRREAEEELKKLGGGA